MASSYQSKDANSVNETDPSPPTEISETFHQFFKYELRSAVMCPTQFPNLANSSNVRRPPSYLFAESPRVAAETQNLDFERASATSTENEPTTCDGLGIDTSFSSMESQGKQEVQAANMAFLDGRKRIAPALPLTSSQLRERVLQVADPALKYSNAQRSPPVEASSRYWWDVPAEETVIHRAIRGRTMSTESIIPGLASTAYINRTQCYRHRSEETNSKNDLPLDYAAVPATKRKNPDPFDLLKCDARATRINLSQFTRKLRINILLLAIGVHPQYERPLASPARRVSRRLDAKIGKPGDGSSSDFLKLTPAEKKAFYSSMDMNRIATGSGVDDCGLHEACLLDGVDASTWTVATCPEILERWCIAGNSKADGSVNNVKLMLWNACGTRISAADLNSDDVQCLGREIAGVEKLARDFEQVCAAWTLALRRLPSWVSEIQAHATVPKWLDRRELDMVLARMEMYALFKTAGRVKWVQNLEWE